MTLGELLEGKTLPVKVIREGWNKGDFFEVFIVKNNRAVGFDETEFPFHTDITQTNYELYIEPKKPEILYEYIFWRNKSDDADTKIMTECRAEVHKRLCEYDGYKKTGRSWPKDELEK